MAGIRFAPETVGHGRRICQATARVRVGTGNPSTSVATEADRTGIVKRQWLCAHCRFTMAEFTGGLASDEPDQSSPRKNTASQIIRSGFCRASSIDLLNTTGLVGDTVVAGCLGRGELALDRFPRRTEKPPVDIVRNGH